MSGHGPRADTTGAVVRLALGALGVVYGDIGTSPLYAIKECFAEPHGVSVTPENVLGILSLMFWALTLVIVVKYLTFVLRADNKGEGGTLALLDPGRAERRTGGVVLVTLALVGTSLLSGEGIITPAISVLSAVEGLGVATDRLEHFVVPVTVLILLGLFLIQRRGTAGIGRVFGPTMLVWFTSIALVALPWIARRPEVLAAVSPVHAVRFFVANRVHGFLVLGSVVLCITGGEALYADMGHFGKTPIRVAWYAVVFPALLVNYFGQGALLLERGPVDHAFYALASSWTLYPMVAIATCATVVASQALISGAFSLAQQAVHLGYFPRVTIVHTSGAAEGQIYVPEINWALMVSCIALVLGFQRSTNLAAAYGIAVTGTMSITSILFFVIALRRWKWSLAAVLPLVTVFLAVDLSFFSANLPKLSSGGWVPLVIGSVSLTIMTTWKAGRARLYAGIVSGTLPLDAFLADVGARQPHRVKGTAVFMTSNPEGAPPVLLHHFKHNKTLHEQVLLLSISTTHDPEVPPERRIRKLAPLGHGFYQVVAAYGFMQTPDVSDIFARLAEQGGLHVNMSDTSFFLGRETLVITRQRGMAVWRKRLFAFLSRNARPANAFFQIPPNRVVELGTQIEL
jgi:KUP system potassium uptake protein